MIILKVLFMSSIFKYLQLINLFPGPIVKQEIVAHFFLFLNLLNLYFDFAVKVAAS